MGGICVVAGACFMGALGIEEGGHLEISGLGRGWLLRACNLFACTGRR